MKNKSTPYLLSLGLPAVLMTVNVANQPFSRVLATDTVSLNALSRQQKLNIATAASRLNGIVVKPHEKFSFNGRIGNRTIHRGYLPAPSYVEKDSPDTIGGGICVLSSIVYQDALQTGVPIINRTPHIRAIHSIPAGLDATVWYPDVDLKFENDLNGPIEIVTRYTPNEITVEFRGSTSWWHYQPAQIQRVETRPNSYQVCATVSTTQYGKTTTISRDKYDLPGVQR